MTREAARKSTMACIPAAGCKGMMEPPPNPAQPDLVDCTFTHEVDLQLAISLTSVRLDLAGERIVYSQITPFLAVSGQFFCIKVLPRQKKTFSDGSTVLVWFRKSEMETQHFLPAYGIVCVYLIK